MTKTTKPMPDKREIKYFIEDTKTNLWYCVPDDHFTPRIHIFGIGWDRPENPPENFWTNNPQDAKAFDSKNKAEKFAKMMLKTNTFEWQDYLKDLEYVEKSIEITEHEFVDLPKTKQDAR